MDAWTVAIVLFDAALLAGLLRLRRNLKALPPPQPRAQDTLRLGPARANLEDAARRLDLEVRGQALGLSLHGRVDGLDVLVEPLGILFDDGPQAMDLKVMVTAADRVDAGLGLHPRSGRASGEALRHLVVLGDPAFDQAFEASGAEAELRAVLTQPHRAALIGLPGRVTVWAGRVSYACTALFAGPDAIERAVREALSVVPWMTAPPDLAARLADVVSTDWAGLVRAGALGCLLRSAPDDEGTRHLCQWALDDPEPRVRLLAAGHVGDPAAPVLAALAAASELPIELRLEALGAAARLSPERWRPILRAALFEGPHPLAVGAAELLGATRDASASAMLAARWPTASTLLAPALLTALARLGHPNAEPVLLLGLTHPAAPVRIAAAEGLGEAGGPTALTALTTRQREDRDADVRREAERAIHRIHARHDLEHGRLSILEPTSTGALSLPRAGPGQLALREPDTGAPTAGRLAIAQEDPDTP